jgi:hypothetical protein
MQWYALPFLFFHAMKNVLSQINCVSCKVLHIDPVGIELKSYFTITEQLAQKLKGDKHTSTDTLITTKEALTLAM